MIDVRIMKMPNTLPDLLEGFIGQRPFFQIIGKRPAVRQGKRQKIRAVPPPFFDSPGRHRSWHREAFLIHFSQEMPFPPGACPCQTEPEVMVRDQPGNDAAAHVMAKQVVVLPIRDKEGRTSSTGCFRRALFLKRPWIEKRRIDFKEDLGIV